MRKAKRKGSLTLETEPLPGELSTIYTIYLTMDSPSPLPPAERVRD